MGNSVQFNWTNLSNPSEHVNANQVLMLYFSISYFSVDITEADLKCTVAISIRVSVGTLKDRMKGFGALIRLLSSINILWPVVSKGSLFCEKLIHSALCFLSKIINVRLNLSFKHY